MMKKEHLANFNIAGFTYYDGLDLLSVCLDCISTKIQMIDANVCPKNQIRVVLDLVNGDENK